MSVLPTPESWARIRATVKRLENQLTNLYRQRIGARHGAGGGAMRKIEFSLQAELRRGGTASATHIPWGNETKIDDLQVTERAKLSSSLKAPPGTTGFAFRVNGPDGKAMWIVDTLDCDKLVPHDGEEGDEESDDETGDDE